MTLGPDLLLPPRLRLKNFLLANFSTIMPNDSDNPHRCFEGQLSRSLWNLYSTDVGGNIKLAAGVQAMEIYEARKMVTSKQQPQPQPPHCRVYGSLCRSRFSQVCLFKGGRRNPHSFSRTASTPPCCLCWTLLSLIL
jgi:hypothetical protein